jgi:hypothetical protein
MSLWVPVLVLEIRITTATTAVMAGGPEFSLAGAAATSSLAICTTITATVPVALTDA